MARKVNSELRELWRERIKRQGQSGLTVAEFCERESVSGATFYAWKRKLRTNGSKPARRATRRQEKRTRPYAEPQLSATRSNVPFVELPVSAPTTSPWIEVVLAEGTVVRLPQHNLTALQTVLRTLNGTVPASREEERRYA
jgi:hypothetical protein